MKREREKEREHDEREQEQERKQDRRTDGQYATSGRSITEQAGNSLKRYRRQQTQDKHKKYRLKREQGTATTISNNRINTKRVPAGTFRMTRDASRDILGCFLLTHCRTHLGGNS